MPSAFEPGATFGSAVVPHGVGRCVRLWVQFEINLGASGQVNKSDSVAVQWSNEPESNKASFPLPEDDEVEERTQLSGLSH